MSSTASGSIDRRDAAVAAALAGAVVVVLGYASGVGIQTSGGTVLAPQPPAVQPAPPQHAAAAPPAAVAQAPVVSAPVVVPVAPAHVHQPPMTDHDHPPVEPAPTPTPLPEPEPTPTHCRPSVLEGLPLAGPLAGVATSLLFEVVRSAPVTGELDPVVYSVADLLSPTCCGTGATEPPGTRAEVGP